MVLYLQKVRDLLKKFVSVQIKYVPRTENSRADTLAKLATALQEDMGESVPIEYLPEVLWAYRTTQKSATRETPFALAFGTEAVAPVEVGIKSPRVELASEEQNEEALRLNLELLDEKREQVQLRTEEY